MRVQVFALAISGTVPRLSTPEAEVGGHGDMAALDAARRFRRWVTQRGTVGVVGVHGRDEHLRGAVSE